MYNLEYRLSSLGRLSYFHMELGVLNSGKVIDNYINVSRNAQCKDVQTCLLTMCNGILRFTPGTTPADLLATELIQSTYLRTSMGGVRVRDLLCSYLTKQRLYSLNYAGWACTLHFNSSSITYFYCKLLSTKKLLKPNNVTSW